MDGIRKEKPRWFFFVIAAGILSVHLFGDEMGDRGLLIPVVAGVFILGFGMLLWQAIKEWKKPDEEIVSGYRQMAGFFQGSGQFTLAQRMRLFLGVIAIDALFLHNAREYPGAVGRYIICAVSLLLFGVPLLRAWLVKNQDAAPRQHKLRPEAVAAVIASLVPVGFMCFFIGIGTYHGAWWFVLPPGLIFLTMFTRPLVAGIRILLKDTSRKEIEPWDRPDKEY